MFRWLSLLIAFYFLVSCSQERIPDIPVRTLERKTVKLSDYRGKGLVLYVWSKTCVGHSRDLKRLSELANRRKDYVVISYAIAMEPEEVLDSYRELGISAEFITLVDTGVLFNDHFAITFLPSTYVFDKRGKLVKTHPGLYIP